jgi:DNA-binding Lrp family transcriptional regulator
MDGQRSRLPEPIELDDVDRRILGLLVQDARLSARAIGREIKMSPNAVSERLERLQQKGVIRGYFAELDPKALGFGMLAIIGLQTRHGPATIDETINKILEVPEVEAVHIVTGQWDLVLEIRVTDQDHLRRVLLKGIWELKDFRHSETMIALASYTRHGSWAPPVIRVSPTDN